MNWRVICNFKSLLFNKKKYIGITLANEIIVVLDRVFEFLESDDDSVIKLLSVLGFTERQVDVIRLVLAVGVLDFKALK